MSNEIVESIVSPAPEAPAQTPETVEAVESTETVPEVQDTDNMTARFAALSRKEKEVREAANRASEIETKYKEYQDLESVAKSDPMALLRKYGVDLDAVIQASLGIEKPEPTAEEQIQALRDEMAAEKQKALDEAEAAKTKEEEMLQASIDEAILKHQHSITDHLSQNQEKYELITLQGAQDLVWEVTEAWYDANEGEILTPEQASDKVEDYLSEQVKKAMQLSRFTPETPKPTEWESTFKTEKVEPKAPISPTLTSESTAPAGSKNVQMTAEESKAAAAALLQWS